MSILDKLANGYFSKTTVSDKEKLNDVENFDKLKKIFSEGKGSFEDCYRYLFPKTDDESYAKDLKKIEESSSLHNCFVYTGRLYAYMYGRNEKSDKREMELEMKKIVDAGWDGSNGEYSNETLRRELFDGRNFPIVDQLRGIGVLQMAEQMKNDGLIKVQGPAYGNLNRMAMYLKKEAPVIKESEKIGSTGQLSSSY